MHEARFMVHRTNSNWTVSRANGYDRGVTTQQLASDASAFLARSIQVLERTPAVLESLLSDLPPEWTHGNEGPGTWSPYDVVGHLIHGERTDWMPRVRIILSGSNDRRFVPFDRFAHLSMDPAEPLASRLAAFRSLRAEGLEELGRLRVSNDDLEKTGVHPEFGDVTLRQLISTWVAHDLGHLVQISRVMAKQIKSDVGPWVQYLRVLQ
jgi:DinB superfamily